jgi:hypothetical protein
LGGCSTNRITVPAQVPRGSCCLTAQIGLLCKHCVWTSEHDRLSTSPKILEVDVRIDSRCCSFRSEVVCFACKDVRRRSKQCSHPNSSAVCPSDYRVWSRGLPIKAAWYRTQAERLCSRDLIQRCAWSIDKLCAHACERHIRRLHPQRGVWGYECMSSNCRESTPFPCNGHHQVRSVLTACVVQEFSQLSETIIQPTETAVSVSCKPEPESHRPRGTRLTTC